jgi:hypothetical protein
MEDAAWSPYDSSFRSSYLAGDSARSETVFPGMKSIRSRASIRSHGLRVRASPS